MNCAPAQCLHLAGFSAGWGVGARVSVGGMFALLLQCLAFDHACCLPQSAKQIGLRGVSFLFPRGSESPVVHSHVLVWLSGILGSLQACAFLAGDSDGVTAGAGYTKRNAAYMDVPSDMDCFSI